MNPNESFAAGYAAGFTQALLLIEARHCEAAASVIDCLKCDEYIACTDATVLVDGRGDISWVNNLHTPVTL
jgi:hypothetical protein